MTLLRFDNVSLAYGHLPLLSHVDLQIEAGERVCLVGRNGTGKSTLLRVVTGAAVPDEGEVWRREGIRIGHLDQEVPPDSEETVFQVVAAGLGELGALLTEYHDVTHAADAAAPASLKRLASCMRASTRWTAGTSIEKWRRCSRAFLFLPVSACAIAPAASAARRCSPARW
jgi:ABC transport system ATP-binding/permease protein